MKKIFIILLLLNIIATSYALCEIYKINNSSEQTLAGVLRNTGRGWYVLEDKGHSSIGIESVSDNDKRIIVHFSIPASKIYTFVVTPDETMTKDGISVGASVGLDKAYIYLYDREGNLINPMEYKEASSNLWVYAKYKISEQ